MSGLSREVLRWIQSLDLTSQMKTPKWDLTNGYLVAEIFSWYFPLEVQMHMYNNGISLDSKLSNWSLLKNFIKRHNLEIPEEYIEGTIHCKENAAQLLVETMYELLTCRKVKKMLQEDEGVEFTDDRYQSNLPMHARCTASQAVKNNLRNTELMADKNLIHCQLKAQSIINNHLYHRKQARMEDPGRFNIKPTLGELAVRHAPYAPHAPSSPPAGSSTQECEAKSSEVEFKEIQVKQLDRTTMKSIPVS